MSSRPNAGAKPTSSSRTGATASGATRTSSSTAAAKTAKPPVGKSAAPSTASKIGTTSRTSASTSGTKTTSSTPVTKSGLVRKGSFTSGSSSASSSTPASKSGLARKGSFTNGSSSATAGAASPMTPSSVAPSPTPSVKSKLSLEAPDEEADSLIEELRAQIEELTARNEAAEEQIVALEGKVTELEHTAAASINSGEGKYMGEAGDDIVAIALRSKVVELEKALAAASAVASTSAASPIPATAAALTVSSSVDAAGAAKIEELEHKIAELQDHVEELQLDHDHLVLEKEELEEQLAHAESSTHEGAGADEHSSAEIRAMKEENKKLREALRRLHEMSNQDRELYGSQQAVLDQMEKESKELRSFKESTTEDVNALRETVDSMAHFEAMIEKLTEQNLELAEKVEEQKNHIADMEDAHELADELDHQQQAQIEADRLKIESLESEIRRYEDQMNAREKEMKQVEKKMGDVKWANKEMRKELEKMREVLESGASLPHQLLLKSSENTALKASQEQLAKELMEMHDRWTESSFLQLKYHARYVRLDAIFGESTPYVEEAEFFSVELAFVSSITTGFEACRSTSTLVHKLVHIYHSHEDIQTTSLVATLNRIYLLLLQSCCFCIQSCANAFTDGTARQTYLSKPAEQKSAITIYHAPGMDKVVDLKTMHERVVQLVHNLIIMLDTTIHDHQRDKAMENEGLLLSRHKSIDLEDEMQHAEERKFKTITDGFDYVVHHMENVMGGVDVVDAPREKRLTKMKSFKAENPEAFISSDSSKNILRSCELLGNIQNVAFPLARLEMYYLAMNTLCDIGLYQMALSLDEVEESHHLTANRYDLESVSMQVVFSLFKSIKAELTKAMNDFDKFGSAFSTHLKEIHEIYGNFLDCFQMQNAGIEYVYPSDCDNQEFTQSNLKTVLSSIRKLSKTALAPRGEAGADVAGAGGEEGDDFQQIMMDPAAGSSSGVISRTSVSPESFRFFPTLLLTNFNAVRHENSSTLESFHRMIHQYWELMISGNGEIFKAICASGSVYMDADSDVNWKVRTTALNKFVAGKLGSVGESGMIAPVEDTDKKPTASSVPRDQFNAVARQLEIKKDELKYALRNCEELREQLSAMSNGEDLSAIATTLHPAGEQRDGVATGAGGTAGASSGAGPGAHPENAHLLHTHAAEIHRLKNEIKILEDALETTEKRAEGFSREAKGLKKRLQAFEDGMPVEEFTATMMAMEMSSGVDLGDVTSSAASAASIGGGAPMGGALMDRKAGNMRRGSSSRHSPSPMRRRSSAHGNGDAHGHGHGHGHHGHAHTVLDHPQYENLRQQLDLWKKVALKRMTDTLVKLHDPFPLRMQAAGSALSARSSAYAASRRAQAAATTTTGISGAAAAGAAVGAVARLQGGGKSERSLSSVAEEDDEEKELHLQQHDTDAAIAATLSMADPLTGAVAQIEFVNYNPATASKHEHLRVYRELRRKRAQNVRVLNICGCSTPAVSPYASLSLSGSSAAGEQRNPSPSPSSGTGAAGMSPSPAATSPAPAVIMSSTRDRREKMLRARRALIYRIKLGVEPAAAPSGATE